MTRNTLVGIPLILTLLLTACRQTPAPVTAEPRGRELAALPTALSAPDFAPPSGHYAEAVLSEGRWQILDGGKLVGNATTLEEFEPLLTSVKERANLAGLQPVLLFSTDAQTPFSQLAVPIKAAETRGISYLFFLVRTSVAQPNGTSSRALPLNICDPMHYGDGAGFLHILIEDSGEIAVGTGASRQTLDSATAGPNLPRLDVQLRLNLSAAQAANSAPVVRVLAQPSVTYQRFIDVLCRFHSNGIRPYFLSDDISSDH